MTVSVARPPSEPPGYATYALGTTAAELLGANPRLRPDWTGADGCTAYRLDSVPGDAAVVSADDRVVWIRLPPRSFTPAGVHVGLEGDEVPARDPGARREGDRVTVAMPGSPPWRYEFPLDDDGRVADVLLVSAGHGCDLEAP
ncbi:MAG: hypothetical protein HOV94_24775 [Saccharothrix sp.]|nr:hypothetical protein [Saccharothrix sp.]